MSIEAESALDAPPPLTCSSCRWYVPSSEREGIGSCNRRPPVMCADGKTRRPTTRPDDPLLVCGEHSSHEASRRPQRVVEAGARALGDTTHGDREAARRSDAYDRWCRVIEAEEGSAAVKDRVREAVLAGKRPWLDA